MYYMPLKDRILKDHSEIRAAMPGNVLLPAIITDEDLAYLGIFSLLVDECPVEAGMTFTLAKPVLEDGGWHQKWDSRASSAEELAAERQVLIDMVTKRAVARLNAFAETRSYGDEQTSAIVSACSYAASTHPRYGAEGRYCMKVREETWDALYSIMADVLAGNRPMPSSFEEIEPELPILNWPE